jgi:hypothetical protein
MQKLDIVFYTGRICTPPAVKYPAENVAMFREKKEVSVSGRIIHSFTFSIT